MVASLSNQQFSSNLVSRVAQMMKDEAGWCSNHSNLLWSSEIFLPTCPKSLLFQVSNLFQHNSKHRDIGKSPLLMHPSNHAVLTTSSHFGSFNHMDSNLNILLPLCLYGFLKKCNDNKEWSNAEHVRWYNLASWNLLSHSSDANARSSRSLI